MTHPPNAPLTMQRTGPGRSRASCGRCNLGITGKTPKVRRWLWHHTAEHQPHPRWN